MPVELRKRKAPQPAPEPPAKKAAKTKVAKAAAKVKEAVADKPSKPTASAKPKANGSAQAATPAPLEAPAPAKGAKPAVGDIVDLEGFGGEIETNDGKKTTLKALVDESKAGVVLFTYPKASTPGCKIGPLLSGDSTDLISTHQAAALENPLATDVHSHYPSPNLRSPTLPFRQSSILPRLAYTLKLDTTNTPKVQTKLASSVTHTRP